VGNFVRPIERAVQELQMVTKSSMIAVDGNTRGATNKRKIPILISQVVPYTCPATKISTYRYECLTKV
jgi:hypothetical protein